jgi:integrase
MGKIGKGIYLRGRIYWLFTGPKNNRKFISLETSDEVEAVKRAVEIRKTAHVKSGEGLNKLIYDFIDYKKNHNEFTKGSEKWYGTCLNLFSDFMKNSEPDTLSIASAQEWYNGLRKSTKEITAVSYVRAVRSFYSWCVDKGFARTNPFKKIKLFKIYPKSKMRFCHQELRDAIIDEAPKDDLKFILYCGFHAGLRIGEIVETRPYFFNLKPDPGLLTIQASDTFTPKDKEARTIPMTRDFKKFMLHYGLKEPFVLKPDVAHGKAILRYDPRRPWEEYMEEFGRRHKIDTSWITFHVMRHTFASLLLSAGVSVYKVAVWMGDEVQTVQSNYGHLSPGDVDIDLGHPSSLARSKAKSKSRRS